MTPSLKSKLVKRLRELADGARPGPYARYCGICSDLNDHGINHWPVLNEVRTWMNMDRVGLEYPFPPGDWGNDRRTLAGILAAYIETEC